MKISVIVPSNKIKTNIMTALSYVSLSTLKDTNDIKIKKLYEYANIINENIIPGKKNIFEVVDLADIDKSTGEISNVKMIDTFAFSIQYQYL